MSQRACPFASASLAEHLVRGIGAAVLLMVTFWLFHGEGLARLAGAIASLAAAVVLMRGCPTCWTIGLVATIGAAGRARQAAGTPGDSSTLPASVPAPR